MGHARPGTRGLASIVVAMAAVAFLSVADVTADLAYVLLLPEPLAAVALEQLP